MKLKTVTAVAYVIQSLLDSLSQVELTEKWQQRMKDTKVRMGVTERHQKRDDEVRIVLQMRSFVQVV